MKTQFDLLIETLGRERSELAADTLDIKKASALAKHSNLLINAVRTQITFAQVARTTPHSPFMTDIIEEK
jgi:hypothetical protein